MDLCEAKTRAGTPCKRVAGWGTDHLHAGRCSYHGGKTPSGRKAGAQALAEKTAARVPATLGLDSDQALTLLSERALYVYDVLARKVDELGEEAWLGGEGSHPWLRAEQEQAKQTAFLHKVRLDAGVEERHVAAVERQGAWLGLAIRALVQGFQAAGLLSGSEGELRVIVERVLGELEQGGSEG